jgi:hypothetical protein
MGPPRTVAGIPGGVTARYLAEALDQAVEKV